MCEEGTFTDRRTIERANVFTESTKLLPYTPKFCVQGDISEVDSIRQIKMCFSNWTLNLVIYIHSGRTCSMHYCVPIHITFQLVFNMDFVTYYISFQLFSSFNPYCCCPIVYLDRTYICIKKNIPSYEWHILCIFYRPIIKHMVITQSDGHLIHLFCKNK